VHLQKANDVTSSGIENMCSCNRVETQSDDSWIRGAQRKGINTGTRDAKGGAECAVGATQDLAALDIYLAAITQAGGWKSPRMPSQYAEKINAARSGMARAAEKAGRDSIEN
jgi:hypothetical protein